MEKILGVFNVSDIHHVPSNQNPSYLVSRGLMLSEFKDKQDFSVAGPDWLKNTVFPNSEVLTVSKQVTMCLVHDQRRWKLFH